MNHYLFKHSIIKIKNLFLNRKLTSIKSHSRTLFSFAFESIDYYIFVDLSLNNSFIYPFKKRLSRTQQEPPFVVFLKKKLVGLKLIDVIQQNSERIAVFMFEDVRDHIRNRFKLIFEIMDRNTNAIVTDQDNVIIQPYHLIDSRGIFPKKVYQPFNENMPDLLVDDRELLLKKFIHGEDILGFGGKLRRLINGKEEFLKLIDVVRSSFHRGDRTLYLYPKNIVYPFFIKGAIREVGDDFLFDLYIEKPMRREFYNKKNNLKRTLQKRLKSLKKRLIKVEGELKKAENFDQYRIFAENLLAHPNLNTNYKDFVELNDIYTAEKITIPLNPKLSLFDNAQNYYKKYKKAKKAIALIENRKKQTEEEISFLEQLIFDVENAVVDDELEYIKQIAYEHGLILSKPRQKPSKEYKPYEKITIDGFDAYIGRNAKGNDIVTMRLANRDDVWFHVKNIPSAHLVVKNPSRLQTLPESVKMEAARIVACRSKAKDGEKVSVDFTSVKNVKKPKGAKPGMVIYSNFKTLQVKKNGCG
ncbi:NFACT RNA binding domain-containing protein [Hippea jasoniae]|uniref:NFACT RNA binding domain-containing protein n=1 Tax=Hippea jasoniae TaxID=944479 RepID=UPI000690AFE0|nr:NFACT family protein [Hippea jasoniae]